MQNQKRRKQKRSVGRSLGRLVLCFNVLSHFLFLLRLHCAHDIPVFVSQPFSFYRCPVSFVPIFNSRTLLGSVFLYLILSFSLSPALYPACVCMLFWYISVCALCMWKFSMGIEGKALITDWRMLKNLPCPIGEYRVCADIYSYTKETKASGVCRGS